MRGPQIVVGDALSLPCGLSLKNRLVKSAMSENMAPQGFPTEAHARVYTRWAAGGWAALITGNIMVDQRYLGARGDVYVPSGVSDEDIIRRWKGWTKGVCEQDCHMIAQLNHPGRQSPIGAGSRPIWSKTVAPSAIPLNIGDTCVAYIARSVVFGTPQEMTRNQIDTVISQFTHAARLASESNFSGVEIHAAHGFLVSQFLSSSSNKRTDDFGGSVEKRTELLLRIIRAVREAVPSSFCVGVKLNSADHMKDDGFADLITQVGLIKKEKVDYVQLSGGTFENPLMFSTVKAPDSKTSKTAAREGFFHKAGLEIRKQYPDLELFLTGGFRSRQGIAQAISSGACDVVCMGRPAVKFPHLPNDVILNGDVGDENVRFDVETAPAPGWLASQIRSVGAGAQTKYYSGLLQKI